MKYVGKNFLPVILIICASCAFTLFAANAATVPATTVAPTGDHPTVAVTTVTPVTTYPVTTVPTYPLTTVPVTTTYFTTQPPTYELTTVEATEAITDDIETQPIETEPFEYPTISYAEYPTYPQDVENSIPHTFAPSDIDVNNLSADDWKKIEIKDVGKTGDFSNIQKSTGGEPDEDHTWLFIGITLVFLSLCGISYVIINSIMSRSASVSSAAGRKKKNGGQKPAAGQSSRSVRKSDTAEIPLPNENHPKSGGRYSDSQYGKNKRNNNRDKR